DRLGTAVETAFFKHVFTRYYPTTIGFSYWRDAKTHLEVDIVAETGNELVPFEVKYQSTIQGNDLKGIRALCASRGLKRAYVVTRELHDFRVITNSEHTSFLHIPAVLACYWLSRSELVRVVEAPSIDDLRTA